MCCRLSIVNTKEGNVTCWDSGCFTFVVLKPNFKFSKQGLHLKNIAVSYVHCVWKCAQEVGNDGVLS